ncbi:7122_t:CDS:2, partial [Ambispora gerdemannii]
DEYHSVARYQEMDCKMLRSEESKTRPLADSRRCSASSHGKNSDTTRNHSRRRIDTHIARTFTLY